jgi:Flp pilus assembly protein TadD
MSTVKRDYKYAALFVGTYVVAAALYVASAARAPAAGDWGDFVAAASVLGVAHPTGYAVYLQFLALPLLALPAAWAAAAADVANALVVALVPALLALWVYRTARGEKGRDAGTAAFAALSGAFFAAAPALWLEATSVEVYGAALALVLGALLLLDAGRRRDDGRFFVAAALAGGLAAGVHLSAFALLLILLIIWAIARRPAPRVILLGVAAWALGLSATLYLPLRAVAAPPLTWSWTGAPDFREVLRHAAGRQFSYNFRVPTWMLAGYRLRELVAALWGGGGPLVLLAPLGLWVLWRRSRGAAVAIVAVVAANVAFLLFYDIPDLASYQLPAVALTFALGAAAAVALFGAMRGRLRLVAAVLAAAATCWAVVAGLPEQRRDPRFLKYYSREIATPVGYRGIYVSGATTSNFLYWFHQYVRGLRPDVELYNINDERCDIDKLAALIWREAGGRPVFADYFFIFQTHQRRAFCRRGRPAGFIMEIGDRDTAPEEAGPPDAAVLGRAADLLEGRPAPAARATAGEDLALSVWEYHGFFYEYRGDDGRAWYYFARTAALAPRSEMPWINLARWRFERGEYDEAREAARKAAAAPFGPNTYMAYGYLAMTEQAEGNLDAALEHARLAVALKPHDGKTHRLLAGVYLERGDRDAARGELERTISAGYNDPDAVMMLAKIYEEEGRDDDAFAVLAENVHDYNDGRLINMYALALVARGRYVEAKAELIRGARIAPDSPEIRGNLRRLEAMGY